MKQPEMLVAESARATPRRGLVGGPDFEFFQRRYFTPAEVAQHNVPEDLWVSYLGSVYDLTPLAHKYKGDLLLKPIVEVAGQDISHWFDPKTRDVSCAGTRGGAGVWNGTAGPRDGAERRELAGVGGRDCPEAPLPIPALKIRKHVDPLTGTLRYRTPRGRFLHVPPQLPRSDWANDFGKPWWQGVHYEVGRLSTKTRNIRIINTLTSQEHALEERPGQRPCLCSPQA
ncbi:cytochrome b5 domain-containing protein 1 isoform X3 [Zalophus californianus]|uniref:Cytochrome b5 domain-containing protein 1 n=1 Tax=Zalophus californianus TaxID=9704 RepID=A0A6J2FNQ3_ZALCA|nr:cytochrome b5 domain-containing protein 1 isoform X3 [Zalophus californianus]